MLFHCKDCKKRKVGCHAKCESYQKDLKKASELRKKAAKVKIKNSVYFY